MVMFHSYVKSPKVNLVIVIYLIYIHEIIINPWKLYKTILNPGFEINMSMIFVAI